jgi:dCMP deaminase
MTYEDLLDVAEHKWDQRFLDLARHVAGWSKDPSTKVGAVVADDRHQVLSVGYNGFPAGMRDNVDLYEDRPTKYSRIIHAEMNALLYMKEPLTPHMTLYTWPMPPCDRCMVHLIQAGLRHVVSQGCQREPWMDAIEKAESYLREVHGTLILL